MKSCQNLNEMSLWMKRYVLTGCLLVLFTVNDCESFKPSLRKSSTNLNEKDEKTESGSQLFLKVVKTARRKVQSSSSSGCEVWTQLGNDLYGNALNETFGTSLALSQNATRLAVGGLGTLRIYSIVSNSSSWSFPIDLSSMITNTIASISITPDGNFLSVGEVSEDDTGKVYVFGFDTSGGSWSQRGNTISEGSATDQFGSSVDISEDGSTVIIGAPATENTPYIRVAILLNNNWLSIKKEESSAGAYGSSVTLTSDGTIAAIGATGEGDGAVYIQETSDLSLDANQLLIGEGGGFGAVTSFSSDGSILAFGSATGKYVKVYTNSGGSFSQLCKIRGSRNDFGSAVDLTEDGQQIVIGSQGQIFVYTATRNSVQLTKFDTTSLENFGSSVSMSGNGNTIAIGGSAVDNGSNTDTGLVRVYQKNP